MEKNISKIIIDKIWDKSRSFVKACYRPKDESFFIMEASVETYVDENSDRKGDREGSAKSLPQKI